MFKYHCTLFILFSCLFYACHKPVAPQPLPSVEHVITHTTVAGQLKYTLLSQPASGVTVYAWAVKFLYYIDNKPRYISYPMDSVRTDSNGFFSMSFDADSLGCTYSLYVPDYALYTNQAFPAGDSSVLPLNYLVKTAEIRVHLIIKNNIHPPLYILKSPEDTGYTISIWPDSLRFYTSAYVADSTGCMYFGYRSGASMLRHTDTIHFRSLSDTATREFIVDPSAF